MVLLLRVVEDGDVDWKALAVHAKKQMTAMTTKERIMMEFRLY